MPAISASVTKIVPKVNFQQNTDQYDNIGSDYDLLVDGKTGEEYIRVPPRRYRPRLFQKRSIHDRVSFTSQAMQSNFNHFNYRGKDFKR